MGSKGFWKEGVGKGEPRTPGCRRERDQVRDSSERGRRVSIGGRGMGGGGGGGGGGVSGNHEIKLKHVL